MKERLSDGGPGGSPRRRGVAGARAPGGAAAGAGRLGRAGSAPTAVADAGYGQYSDFRLSVAGRRISRVGGIRRDLSVHPHTAPAVAPRSS
ncbi:transposase [Streptomyces sp. NPDC093065]|uniref:transposase n=1 Tax=Streptomyces sp. NPDC093065 TaxID=3366021 RepID=UPI00381D8B52